MSQNTNTPTKVVATTAQQKQAAENAATLPNTIADSEILGGNALPQDSFGDAADFVAHQTQQAQVAAAPTLADNEPKIAVVKKEQAPASIDEAFGAADEQEIVETVSQNVLDEANAAVAQQVQVAKTPEVINEVTVDSMFTHTTIDLDQPVAPANAETLAAEVDSFLSAPDIQDRIEDDFEDDLDAPKATAIRDPFSWGLLNTTNVLGSYLLELATVGLSVTHVDGDAGLQSLRAFPINAYTGLQSTNPAEGSLKLQRVSLKAAMPELEDEDQVIAILNTLESAKRYVNVEGLNVFIYVSQEYDELAGEKFENLADAFNNGDIVQLNTLTTEQILECSEHELLFVLLSDGTLGNTINLRYVGDPDSILHYTKDQTEEMIAPSLQVFSKWVNYLQNSGLHLNNPHFWTNATEEGETITWTESLQFNVIGHKSLVDSLINPVFGGEKLLSNLDRDSEYEVGRYESCSIVVTNVGSRGTAGSEFTVIVTATHTNASNYESADESDAE